MNQLTKYLAAISLNLVAAAASFAAPAMLEITNNTDAESNAYIAGHASPKPSKPYSVNSVPWAIVKMACVGHTVNGQCAAVIKMETDTANPVEIGTVEMNVTTGEISPSTIQAHGYVLTVTGIAKGVINRA